MTQVSLKEACRLFWMTKGHLNTSEQTIRSCYDSYFKRLWYNNEAYIKEEGFEEAFKSFLDNQ
tara:strand:+ start:4033 stop:4221 length:189 start_codon:yes stop_codon:yes gene_type:complete